LLPAWRFARWCRGLGVRHVHVATPANSLIIAQMACMMADLTCDTTINAKLEWWGGAMREKLGRCHAVFPVAEWMREQIARDYPQVLARTVVARHGVDTAAWDSSGRIAADDGPLRIVSVGRLHPAKGHDDLLRAVRMLVDRGQDVRLRIAGGGADYERLSTMIQELDIAQYAALTGPLQETGVRALLEASDLFALASHAEALGVVFMEAMAIGVPVIATRTDGAQEVIEDGVTGVLVGIQRPQEIADAIESVLDNPLRRAEMAARGLQRVRERFDCRVGARIVSDRVKAILSETV
jgi:glycosyltransferase involved in cell wall biosynthesis